MLSGPSSLTLYYNYMKNFCRYRLVSLFSLIIFSLFLAVPVLADQGGVTPPTSTEPISGNGILSGNAKDRINAQAQATGGSAGFNLGLGVDDIVSTVIGVVLGTLGIIFLVLIVVAGYQWMTAGGNEEAIKSAKNRMVNAIIGLAIVLAAWAITVFVFRNLPFTAGGGGQGGDSQVSP